MTDLTPHGPAFNLVGQVLLNEWVVSEQLQRDSGRSGIARSCCYRAISKDGHIAFVKAYDFRHEDQSGTPDDLEDMLREFNNERRVHEHCRDSGLSRITKLYGSGKVILDRDAVHFLICEYAPKSLHEAHPPGDETIAPCDRLFGLRKVAAGLAQLHQVDVAHQDVKPSNVVSFPNEDLKLTDLGSSSCLHLPAPPHDEYDFCGQPGYAPYELLYNDRSGTWYRRRIGCDMFLLGNLAFTSFVGGSLSMLIAHSLPDCYRHTGFAGNYQDVLPYLISLHYDRIPAFRKETAPACIADELIACVLAMCHPDPAQRGHALNVAGKGGQYGLERFISAFDRMARRCQIESKRAA